MDWSNSGSYFILVSMDVLCRRGCFRAVCYMEMISNVIYSRINQHKTVWCPATVCVWPKLYGEMQPRSSWRFINLTAASFHWGSLNSVVVVASPGTAYTLLGPETRNTVRADIIIKNQKLAHAGNLKHHSRHAESFLTRLGDPFLLWEVKSDLARVNLLNTLLSFLIFFLICVQACGNEKQQMGLQGLHFAGSLQQIKNVNNAGRVKKNGWWLAQSLRAERSVFMLGLSKLLSLGKSSPCLKGGIRMAC